MLSRNEVKYIQSLYHKKNRNADNVFIAEGIKLVDELLKSNYSIKKIYALNSWITENKTITNVTEISEAELKKISNFETPNKVFAIAGQQNNPVLPDFRNKITLLLDGIQDPGNLGTIIRTADWFGIKNIIASNDTADIYNFKVVQATMGSIAHVNIFYTDALTFLSNNTIMVYGAFINGADVAELKQLNECILVVGNEANGIRDAIIPFINKKITVPAFGKAESLNAAVAAGIILWKLTIL